MNQNFTQAKFLAVFFSLILIITFNTQAESRSGLSHLDSNNPFALNILVNNSDTQESIINFPLKIKGLGVGCLPVKYLSFEGKVVKNSLLLNWTTTEEINNNYFQIERSFNGIDFTQIGLALDGFENGTKREYAFKDYSDLLRNKKIIYYRLKQIDNDGSYNFSKNLIVSLK